MRGKIRQSNIHPRMRRLGLFWIVILALAQITSSRRILPKEMKVAVLIDFFLPCAGRLVAART